MFDLDKLPDSEEVEAKEFDINDLEEVVMELIINSGQARSLAYEALRSAKAGDFEKAKTQMAESRESLNGAHLVQTKLIESDMGEGLVKVNLVMVHAQDHLMTSMLARELIAEMIELHQTLANK